MSFKNVSKSAVLAGLAVVFMSGAAFAGADKLTQAHDSLTAAATAVQADKTPEALKDVKAARMDIKGFEKGLKSKEAKAEAKEWVKELEEISKTLKGKDKEKITATAQTLEDLAGKVHGHAANAMAPSAGTPATTDATKGAE